MENELGRIANEYVKSHKSELITHFADLGTYLPDDKPISIFMAGSPGAGKTEFSKRLIEKFSGKPVRIDADEIREWIPDHKSSDASVYQTACTTGVNKLYDYVIKHGQNVILDGTFAYVKAFDNVQRSIKYGRKTIIYFLYQDPVISWKFTKDRELLEHRNVPLDVFTNAYLESQTNVERVKSHFGKDVELNMVVKDYEKDLEKLHLNVSGIENYLPKRYNKAELEQLLS